ncbi:hypothetical protein, partial [Luteibacter sp. 22Crub2.1]|uniref:hypothetical protein n=1 Tax=Luteibacter sp. 22Crub2.1 TaxID=1283288 RepID=UPI0020CA79DA
QREAFRQADLVGHVFPDCPADAPTVLHRPVTQAAPGMVDRGLRLIDPLAGPRDRVVKELTALSIVLNQPIDTTTITATMMIVASVLQCPLLGGGGGGGGGAIVGSPRVVLPAISVLLYGLYVVASFWFVCTSGIVRSWPTASSASPLIALA